jgi:hypothetical protein
LELGDRGKELLARPDRKAEVFQARVIEMRQSCQVDLVLREDLDVLGEPEFIQPLLDVAYHHSLDATVGRAQPNDYSCAALLAQLARPESGPGHWTKPLSR